MEEEEEDLQVENKVSDWLGVITGRGRRRRLYRWRRNSAGGGGGGGGRMCR